MTIAETYDPQSALVPPAEAAENFADSLRWKAGPLLGGLDWLFAQIMDGRSLIAELVEPVAGDWVGLEMGAGAWLSAAAATDAIAANIAAMDHQVDATWWGEGASAFKGRISSVADGFGEYADGCRTMSEVTSALLDLCKAAAETIASILGFVGDYLTRLVIEAAVPIAGWIAGAIDGAASAILLINKLNQGYRVIQTVLTTIERYRDVITTIVRLAAAIEAMARALTTILKVTSSVGDITSVTAGDGAVANQFGVEQ